MCGPALCGGEFLRSVARRKKRIKCPARKQANPQQNVNEYDCRFFRRRWVRVRDLSFEKIRNGVSFVLLSKELDPARACERAHRQGWERAGGPAEPAGPAGWE